MALQKVNTRFLAKSTLIGAAGTFTSDPPLDLRDINSKNNMSVTLGLAATGGATCGSSLCSYSVCSTFDGTYIPAGTFGTFADTPGNYVRPISSPVVAPFMRVICVAGTSSDIKLTAELHVQ